MIPFLSGPGGDAQGINEIQNTLCSGRFLNSPTSKKDIAEITERVTNKTKVDAKRVNNVIKIL